MNLADLIEKRRFVGQEFLVFLWFESELTDGQFDVDGFGACEIRLEGQISLAQEKEQSKLKGISPSATPEAHEALRQGKMPKVARVKITRGDLEFGLVLNAETLGLSAVKIPKVISEEGDEQFYERAYLIEDLESLLSALYAKFIALRLSTAWDAVVAPAIRAWIHGREVDVMAYRRARAMVRPIGHRAPPNEASEKAERAA